MKQLDEKKILLDSKRPLAPNTLKSIREKILLDWTYNSNAIEGNTLTLIETRVVLEGITVGGKSLKEHLEVVNKKKAICYIEDIVQKNELLSEWQIRNIHALILKNIDDAHAGVYRKENVLIAGAGHIPPNFLIVPDLMQEMIRWYDNKARELHPVKRAAILHAELVKIHPFADGNGRTARLILNFELMKSGFPPIVFKKEDRLTYYESLDRFCLLNDHSHFIALTATRVEEMLDFYLKLIG